MHDLIYEVIRNEDTLLMVLAAGTIVLCSLFGSITRIVTGLARERTRREIAAYIAEGSMTPEQGERVLNARHRNA
ncbi:MAG: hypothetical protein D6695_03190 [Planctomycetota bacterium]|nr:MAG: hypothetical protein D6695_03190 [Planctomycetota bacterium]